MDGGLGDLFVRDEGFFYFKCSLPLPLQAPRLRQIPLAPSFLAHLLINAIVKALFVTFAQIYTAEATHKLSMLPLRVDKKPELALHYNRKSRQSQAPVSEGACSSLSGHLPKQQ